MPGATGHASGSRAGKAGLRWCASEAATTDGRGTSVPVHRNQEVRVGTLRGLPRDCRLTVGEFLESLD